MYFIYVKTKWLTKPNDDLIEVARFSTAQAATEMMQKRSKRGQKVLMSNQPLLDGWGNYIKD